MQLQINRNELRNLCERVVIMINNFHKEVAGELLKEYETALKTYRSRSWLMRLFTNEPKSGFALVNGVSDYTNEVDQFKEQDDLARDFLLCLAVTNNTGNENVTINSYELALLQKVAEFDVLVEDNKVEVVDLNKDG